MKTLRALYFIVANTLILLVLALLSAHLLLIAYLYLQDSLRDPYQRLSNAVKRNYAHMRPEDVNAMLRVTNSIRFRYASWVGYREAETRSRFVNVDEHGIRANGGAPRDIASIEGAIWFFGGSTAFGYGVVDAETIPARLEQLLGRPVVNFGVGGYYSAQETLLFDLYLRAGYRPSIAVFFDGINERCDILDDYLEATKPLFARAQARYQWDAYDFAKPVIHVYRGIQSRVEVLLGLVPREPEDPILVCESSGRRRPLSAVHAELLAERDALCRLHRVDCRTFVQPFADIHGRHEDGTLPDLDRRGMRTQFEHLEAGWRSAGAIFVTDALDQLPRHAFVDDAHYSAEASDLIARAIAARLK